MLPDSSSIKDPKQLTELLVVHGVTVWNSVPAQMQMVINYMENSKVKYYEEEIDQDLFERWK